MKKIFFTFALGALFTTVVMAQAPSSVIKKASVEPVIDGTIDAVWSETDSLTIDLLYKGETPTLGDAGTTWWKALWNDKGVYVLINVNDDIFAPAYEAATTTSYVYDHPEIYFDTNFILKDSKGPQTDGSGNGNGHYQFAPHPIKDSINSGVASTTGANGSRFSYNVADPTYLVEYFIPFSKLLDQDGILMDKTGTIGFDVTICDSDIPSPNGKRNRAVWSNIGTINESWGNMDDCGTITFEGAAPDILVEEITVSGGATITNNNGTLQMVAEIQPIDATNKAVKWVIENGTGMATISKDGLLTALKDGTVLVKAMAIDASNIEGKATVTISGQVVDQNEIWNTFNLIKNWSFENGMSGTWPTSWGGWVDTDPNNNLQGQVAPTIEDGVVVMTVAQSKDNQGYHYQLNQSNLMGESDMPYTLKFKSWATADATKCEVDFEDTQANGYTRYGSSSDPEAVLTNNGTSDWHYVVGTEPAWYTFHVIFDKILETTVQKIQWMNSYSNQTIYLDSVLVIKDADLALSESTLANAKSKVQLYPNPVQTELTISKIAVANSKVAVYNVLSQKLMEKTAKGTEAKFNVANLRNGMYFVRFSNGTSEKFTKQ